MAFESRDMPDDVIERDAEVTKLNHAIEWLEMDPVAIGKGDSIGAASRPSHLISYFRAFVGVDRYFNRRQGSGRQVALGHVSTGAEFTPIRYRLLIA